MKLYGYAIDCARCDRRRLTDRLVSLIDAVYHVSECVFVCVYR